MAITFDKIVASPKYQSADAATKQKIKQSYLQDVVANVVKMQHTLKKDKHIS